MKRRHTISTLALTATLSLGCAESSSSGWDWNLPPGFPEPPVPSDNPMTKEKVELGRRLFYDEHLSANETRSCGSCHEPALAFTDGLPQAIGATGKQHPRNTMSLVNVAYATTLTWANPELYDLEGQAHNALFGGPPPEVGMNGPDDDLLPRLSSVDVYVDMFERAFPDSEQAITLEHVYQSLATFERTLVSAGSPYDRYIAGNESAISTSAKNGMALFFSEKLDCLHCHSGENLSSSHDHAGIVSSQTNFENNGLYNIDSVGGYPTDDTGLHAFTGRPSDMGKFKPPSLRNIAVTAPYMHDGSIGTLEDVLDHYARGGRVIEDGPHAGDGRESPLKSPYIAGFELTPQERADVLAFLKALTDESSLNRPDWTAPL